MWAAARGPFGIGSLNARTAESTRPEGQVNRFAHPAATAHDPASPGRAAHRAPFDILALSEGRREPEYMASEYAQPRQPFSIR